MIAVVLVVLPGAGAPTATWLLALPFVADMLRVVSWSGTLPWPYLDGVLGITFVAVGSYALPLIGTSAARRIATTLITGVGVGVAARRHPVPSS